MFSYISFQVVLAVFGIVVLDIQIVIYFSVTENISQNLSVDEAKTIIDDDYHKIVDHNINEIAGDNIQRILNERNLTSNHVIELNNVPMENKMKKENITLLTKIKIISTNKYYDLNTSFK